MRSTPRIGTCTAGEVSRYDVPPLPQGEIVSRLGALAHDEELPPTARIAIAAALRSNLPHDALDWLLRVSFDCRAGMRTGTEVARIAHDLVAAPKA